MREFRKANGVTEHYTSLEALRAAWNCKPIVKRTKDEERLQKQRENFCKRHICKGCGKPMSYIGGTTMTCTNEKCKGVREERTDKEGNVIVTYSVSYSLLDDKGAEIASNIFD